MLLYLSVLGSSEERDKFEILYHTYKNLMFYIADQILGDTKDSEDVVHQAFVKILEYLDKIHDPKCPQTKAFIVTIVERKAIDLYRKRQKIKQVSFETVMEQETSPFDTEVAAMQGTLVEAIRALPARYRQVILLRFDSGFSEREIAKMLSLSEANVKKTLQRAKAKLAEILEGEEDVK